MLRIVVAAIAFVCALGLGYLGLILISNGEGHDAGEVTVHLPWGDMSGDAAGAVVLVAAVASAVAAVVALTGGRTDVRSKR